MNLLQRFLVLFAIIIAFNTVVKSAHFTFNTNTDNNMVIVVPTISNPKIGNEALSNGDEIGAFTPAGNCIGGIVWDGNDNAITVYGFNSSTNPNGAKPGDKISYRVWDASENLELSSVTVTFSQDPPFDVFNENYAANGFGQLTSLVAAKKPGKPSFTNPTNNAVGVALSGNLTINAAGGATSHTIQLSTTNNFASKLVDATGTITSAAYTGLSNNTTYFARALGTNAEGDGDFETISFKTLLATPTLANPADNAKGLNETSISLSWNSVSGATSYTVQVATNNTFTTGLVEQTVNTTNATFNGLSVFTDYFWRVMAKDGANTSAFSLTRTFKTRVGTTTVTSPANNATGVALNGNIQWSAVTGATSYDVMLIKLPATTIINQNVATNQIAYSNLENFTNYQITVIAKNSDGSGATVTSNFRTILGIPTLTSPTDNAFNQPLGGTVSWSSVAGAATYDVRIATDAAFTNVVSSQNDVAITSFVYAGLVTNQKYFWQVRAKNAEGTSPFSSSFAFTTILAAPVLVAPANNTTQVSLNPTLTWNAAPGATLYQVQVATNSNFNTIVAENAAVAGTSLQVNGLSSKTVYFYRARGYNANSNGQFSAPFTFTTMLGKVNLTSPANGTQGIVAANGTLSWQALSGATSYDILVSLNADLSSPIVNANIPGTSFNYNGLLNNSTYFWAVKGKDADGTGEQSVIFSFGTQVVAPTLLTPPNNATNVVLQGSCTWTAIAGATSYQLQFATDAAFTNIVSDQTGIEGTTGNYTGLQNNTNHFWRVRGYKGNGAGIFSGTFTFKTMSLAPPTALFPPNNAIDLYTTVNFVWSSVNEATGYNFRYATDPNMMNVLQTVNNLQQTQYTVMNLFTERDYYWQVQTVGAQGVSNWSNPFKLTTLFPSAFNGPLTICENKQGVYTTSVSPLVDYLWTVTGGTIVGSSTSHTVTVNWGAAGQGTINLKRTSAAWGNYFDNLSKNVTKTSVANVTVTLNANTYYPNKACRNEPVNLSAALSSNGVFSYSWTLNNNVVSTTKDFVYTFANAGSYTFNFTATGVDCEAGQASITVVVDGACPITIVNASETFSCKDGSPVLTTKVFGGTGSFSYAWTPTGDFVNASVVSPIVKSAAFSKNYYLLVTDLNSGTTESDIASVTVYQTPSVSFNPSNLIVRNSSAVDLTDPTNVTTTISGGTAPYTQNWTDNNGTQIDPTNVLPQIGTNRYYLTVLDNNGCASVAKRFNVIRYNSKDNVDYDLTSGINGEGIMFTYPNPVVNNLNISADFETSQNVRIRVMNMIGQDVVSFNIGNVEIYNGNLDLSKLSAGVYTLIIESELNTFVKTFVKQ
jgi:hypothetical protein